MSRTFTRDGDGIAVDLAPQLRGFIADLAGAVAAGVTDDAHPFAARLRPPIAVHKDRDDEFLVLMRSDAIATAALRTQETTMAVRLSEDDAEAWFETLQVGSTAMAGVLGIRTEADLDAVEEHDLRALRLLQALLGELVEELGPPAPPSVPAD